MFLFTNSYQWGDSAKMFVPQNFPALATVPLDVQDDQGMLQKALGPASCPTFTHLLFLQLLSSSGRPPKALGLRGSKGLEPTHAFPLQSHGP